MKRRLIYQESSRRAFVAIDAMFGIIIVSVVSVVLATTLSRVRSTEIGLADSRSALHLAEHALLNLQHGQPIPVATGDSRLSIHRLATGTAPPGFIWAKVDVSLHGHNEALFGVVPIAAMPWAGG
jgi:hypothetical protein